jgi:ubiquitin-conjugating enzyme E2 Q
VDEGTKVITTIVPDHITLGRMAFVPGTVERSTLPILPEPAWGASSLAALKNLSRNVKDLQATQSSTPLAHLGWYVDFDKMDNLFQWIVEMHSFPKSLPLAKDMKKAR